MNVATAGKFSTERRANGVGDCRNTVGVESRHTTYNITFSSCSLAFSSFIVDHYLPLLLACFLLPSQTRQTCFPAFKKIEDENRNNLWKSTKFNTKKRDWPFCLDFERPSIFVRLGSNPSRPE